MDEPVSALWRVVKRKSLKRTKKRRPKPDPHPFITGSSDLSDEVAEKLARSLMDSL